MAPDTIFTAVVICVLFATNLKRCSFSSSFKNDQSNNYLTLIFWHNIIITSSTPLLRLMYNRWYAHTPLHWLFSSAPSKLLMGNSTTVASAASAGLPSSFPYPTTAQAPDIDTAFFLHSIFGLAWVIIGHITLVYSHRWGTKAHRRMGYAAFFSFAMHMCVAVYTVSVDVVKHHPLPRIMLLLNPIMSGRFMLGAIVAAKRGDVRTHQTLMLRLYLYSTEGAGTIRQVEHFMWMLRTGPGLCQLKYDSLATMCVWPYAIRLIFTRMLTQYHLACIAKLRCDVKLYDSVVREVRGFVYVAAGLCAATYVMGLDGMGQWLQNGGYVALILCEACLPKPGVDGLTGIHSFIFG